MPCSAAAAATRVEPERSRADRRRASRRAARRRRARAARAGSGRRRCDRRRRRLGAGRTFVRHIRIVTIRPASGRVSAVSIALAAGAWLDGTVARPARARGSCSAAARAPAGRCARRTRRRGRARTAARRSGRTRGCRGPRAGRRVSHWRQSAVTSRYDDDDDVRGEQRPATTSMPNIENSCSGTSEKPVTRSKLRRISL